MYLNEDYFFILEELIRRKSNMVSLINDWLKNKKDFNMMSIPPRDLNKKFNSLSKPTNKHCKNDFIDYNNIIDYVLQTSISYNESSKLKPNYPKQEKINNNQFDHLSNSLNNQPFFNKTSTLPKGIYDNYPFTFPQNPFFVALIRPELNNLYSFPLQIPVQETSIKNNLCQENFKGNKLNKEINEFVIRTEKKNIKNIKNSNNDRLNLLPNFGEGTIISVERDQNFISISEKNNIKFDKQNKDLCREINPSINETNQKMKNE
jgi:hypothetical protein